ncbi:MAG: radical SAM protein [Nitrospirae bacterium]|nr:radical SAM protein [Nitrospirota bacterium]
MRYFLSEEAVLKWLETPSVYHISADELYELDEESFSFLRHCASPEGAESEENDFICYCLKEGVLTTEAAAVKRPPVLKSPVPSLRYLELQITNRCNLRCKHCYIDLPSHKGPMGGYELPVERVRNILTEFEEMQGLRVLITGGEPLMHSRFSEINAILPQFAGRKVLLTNGLLLNREIIECLNVDEIQVSIDGMEDAHDALRGPGTFRSAIEAIKLARQSGLGTSVSTMVHAKNLGDFDEMERLFKDLGIRDWSVDVPCVTGRLEANAGFQVRPEQGGRYLGYGYGGGLHAGAAGFGCGLHLMSVLPDGRAAKCTFYADRAAGNIADGIRQCWEKIKPVRLDTLECDCVYIEACRGGCRYRAEQLGNPLGRDIYRCFFYDILKQNDADMNSAYP